jgi:hypothetical protein
VAHRALAEHLTQSNCQYSSLRSRCHTGALFPDKKAPHVYWLVRTVDDERPNALEDVRAPDVIERPF